MKREGITGAEALLRALRAMGVERIFASPGSDWAPLWEALARPHDDGEFPAYISSRHEETAVGMATGYFKATGKLPAVVIHTTVGSLHAAMGVRAALHERVPMVVLAGESVEFAEGPSSAGRQWLRVLTDLGGPARLMEPTVKWSFGLNTSVILPHTIQRACQLAMSAPRGPVFVAVPTEMLMETAAVEAPKAVLPSPVTADPSAIASLSDALSKARKPVIVTEELGRDEQAVTELVALAETLGAPVVDGWHADYVNFPRRHPLYGGVATEPVNEVVKSADFVLLAEAVAPWHPPSAVTGVPVAALGEDPLHSNLPYWGFRADHVVAGDVRSSLKSLRALLKPRKPWLEKKIAVEPVKAETRITSAWIAQELNAVLPPDAIVVNETISHRGEIMKRLDRLGPGSFYEASYGGLGMGTGTALGVKYAKPQRPVALLIGDGSFYYNPVPAAFGACQEHGLPLLVVLFDNAGYFSQKNDVVREYPQGFAVKTNRFIGTSITPCPDYALLAQAFGGRGEKVEKPADVRPALERGLAAVAKGKLALVHMVLEPVNR
jgi:acetolactate synthase-1/2/3 large subunit